MLVQETKKPMLEAQGGRRRRPRLQDRSNIHRPPCGLPPPGIAAVLRGKCFLTAAVRHSYDVHSAMASDCVTAIAAALGDTTTTRAEVRMERVIVQQSVGEWNDGNLPPPSLPQIY